YRAANIEGTKILLEESRAAGVRRIVNIGTPSIYFDYTDTLNRAEDYLPDKMADNYAASKYEAETMLLKASESGIETISLRPRFTTGRGETNILGRFIKMHQSGKFRQIGSGENIVDFTAVKNMVDALWLACSAPTAACGEAYNITNGDPVKLWPFLNRLMENVGLPPITRNVPYPVAAAAGLAVETISRMRGVEPPLTKLGAAVMAKTMTMSIEKAKAKLGYRPNQTNEEMLDEFVGWWREVSR
ncbi:NAD-dependent epimerase/dehydratase family protein, partial [Candidatus Sumerlaeota bacterium]|nr:NAD-dependent epimerase/dehydratase family protein [Candidatus Sumerlaeota bacterium]